MAKKKNTAKPEKQKITAELAASALAVVLSESSKNVIHCVEHKIPMTIMLSAAVNDLDIETFMCLVPNCLKESILYTGGVDISVKIREHHGLE